MMKLKVLVGKVAVDEEPCEARQRAVYSLCEFYNGTVMLRDASPFFRQIARDEILKVAKILGVKIVEVA
jgi:hypothetical protein